MASCEKCWSDSYMRIHGDPMKSQTEHYHELLKERKEKPCTREQQAGEDAEVCPTCDRKTVHQYAKTCVICGFNTSRTKN